MDEFDLLGRLGPLPRPFDLERARSGLERWHEAAAEAGPETAEFALRLSEDARGRALLEALLGNSPFLGGSLIADPGFAQRLLGGDPGALLAEILAETAAAPEGEAEAALMARLRTCKRRLALLTAVADIGGLWDLPAVTGALTGFAEASLGACIEHLLRRSAAAGDLTLADPARPAVGSGLAILGMGKLGARELNYSSDIDLIVLFDREVVRYTGQRTPQDCFIRLARDLVRLMQERTSEGYVLRVDLRLRPDPGATPVAISMEAAEHYYETLGQNWERAAMIKARCVGGDLAAGEEFLRRIAPFVWRKHLDFAAIEDIHSIKRQIHAHKGHGQVVVPGHNIKLGRGGIREIEFFAQTQQLIAGGRDRRLRVRDTCGALQAFAATGRLAPEVAEELILAYGFLRRLEHRLQMIADEQTHTLPEDPAGIEHVAAFLGYQDGAAFTSALMEVLNRVQRHYAQLFEAAPELAAGGGSLVFTGTEDDPETLDTLASFGYRDAHMVAAAVRSWHHGRFRAMRSVRARELLTVLMPRLLQALARTANPDAAFVKFDEFLGRLPAGVQLFSLFYANPNLLDLVAEIMGTAPGLAEQLGRNPSLLDAVLAGDFHEPLPDADALTEELGRVLEPARDFQDLLDLSRRWAGDRRFQVGVQVLRGTVDAEASGRALSDLAEAILRALLPGVEDEFARQHGRLAGGGMAVIGLGKLGGREMTFGSDLDLIFVYDHAEGAEASDGPRPLAPSQYFARLSQRMINALTALTPEGRLYDVDMRLRPSGNAGPIALHVEGFRSYQKEQAWTWEHMALTRGRPLAGPERLCRRIGEAIREALVVPREPERLRHDVAEMRRRIAEEHGSSDPWNIKYVRGGLIDLEFLAQHHQLLHAAAAPEVIDGNTAEAFRRLGGAGLLAEADARLLAEATVFLRGLQGLLRLCAPGRFEEEAAPLGLQAVLARTGKAPDFGALRRKLIATEARVAEMFEATLGRPPAAAAAGT